MVTNVAVDIKCHHVSTCCTALDIVHPASMEKKNCWRKWKYIFGCRACTFMLFELTCIKWSQKFLLKDHCCHWLSHRSQRWLRTVNHCVFLYIQSTLTDHESHTNSRNFVHEIIGGLAKNLIIIWLHRPDSADWQQIKHNIKLKTA